MSESVYPSSSNALGRRLIRTFVVSELCLIAGNLIVRICLRWSLLPEWALMVVAIVSAIPMLIYAIRFFRMLRTDLDEMLQRIALEGLAFAAVVFVPLAGLYVNLRAAEIFSFQLDPPELLLIPSLLVVVGVLISWSRHK